MAMWLLKREGISERNSELYIIYQISRLSMTIHYMITLEHIESVHLWILGSIRGRLSPGFDLVCLQIWCVHNREPPDCSTMHQCHTHGRRCVDMACILQPSHPVGFLVHDRELFTCFITLNQTNFLSFSVYRVSGIGLS